MGIEQDNWPATVGIFTGLFAKEVVVGTLDALYSNQGPNEDEFNFMASMAQALASIPENLQQVFLNLDDPLGLDLGDLSDQDAVAQQQDIATGTIGAIQQKFHGQWGAFVYLMFILLYMPCVATVGAIIKEHGHYWAGFSMLWSLSVAYVLSVGLFQVVTWQQHPQSSFIWLVALSVWQLGFTFIMLRSGKRKALSENIIPVMQLD